MIGVRESFTRGLVRAELRVDLLDADPDRPLTAELMAAYEQEARAAVEEALWRALQRLRALGGLHDPRD